MILICVGSGLGSGAVGFLSLTVLLECILFSLLAPCLRLFLCLDLLDLGKLRVKYGIILRLGIEMKHDMGVEFTLGILVHLFLNLEYRLFGGGLARNSVNIERHRLRAGVCRVIAAAASRQSKGKDAGDRKKKA